MCFECGFDCWIIDFISFVSLLLFPCMYFEFCIDVCEMMIEECVFIEDHQCVFKNSINCVFATLCVLVVVPVCSELQWDW